MRVLIVITSDARRGAQIEGHRLASELTNASVTADAVALAGSGDEAVLDLDTLGSTPLGPATLRKLRRRAKMYDVVVAYGSTTLPACAIALAGGGTPFVYRSIGDPAAWVRGGWHRRRTGTLMRRAARVVALWPAAGAQVVALYRVRPDRVTSISNARSPQEFRAPTAGDRDAARRHFGLPENVPVAGVFGSLAPEKRVELAVDAVARTDDWHLLIVGDGPERASIESAAKTRLGPRGVIAGLTGDMPAAYWAIDALLMTSSTEGMPGVALEAALSRVPIISTDVGAMSWLFERGVRGTTVTTDDPPAAIAHRLRDLDRHHNADGPDDRFSWFAVVEQWQQLLSDVVDTSGSPTQPASGVHG